MGLRQSFFVIFLAFILTLTSDSIAKDIENLLINPDFEQDTNGWSLGNGNILSIDKKEKCPTGTNAVKAAIEAVGANAWEPEIHSPMFSLTQNKKYTYSFWSRAEAGKTKAIYTCFERNNPSWAGAGGLNITLTEEWKEYKSTSTWTAESSPQVVIHIALNYPPTHMVDAWFAHFKVYEGDYVEEVIPGLKPKAVTPLGNLTIPWGKIKSR